jgi:quercetin dioxygenase-like cupin family protein
MIVRGDDVLALTTGPGVRRKVLAADGSLMAVEVSFQKGSVGAPHSHPHQQIGYIVKGSFELEMEGKRTIIKAGDSYYAQPNVVHGVVALEDGVILDVFTPQREDFLK